MAELTFGKWLVRTREEKGWSQDRLAHAARDADPKTRLSQARVSEYEREKGLPNLRQLSVIGRVLGLSVEEGREGRDLWEAEQLHESSEFRDAPVT